MSSKQGLSKKISSYSKLPFITCASTKIKLDKNNLFLNIHYFSLCLSIFLFITLKETTQVNLTTKKSQFGNHFFTTYLSYKLLLYESEVLFIHWRDTILSLPHTYIHNVSVFITLASSSYFQELPLDFSHSFSLCAIEMHNSSNR